MAEKRKLTDDDIRNCRRITTTIAAQYLDNGWSAMGVACRMRAGALPIGVATPPNSNKSRWTYSIVAERLIAYKHGRLPSSDIDVVISKMQAYSSDINKMIDALRAENAMSHQ